MKNHINRGVVFEGGVAKVYIPHIVSRGVWGHAPPGNFIFFNKFLHTAGVHEIAELIWYMNLYQYIGFYKSLKC